MASTDNYKLLIFSIIEDIFPDIIIEHEIDELEKFYFYKKGLSKQEDSLTIGFSTNTPRTKDDWLFCLVSCCKSANALNGIFKPLPSHP